MQEERELSWTDKFNLIEEELKKNPARSDMLIARTVGLDKVSKASVYRTREVLVADGKVPHVPFRNRINTNGNNGSRNDSFDTMDGNRIAVPDGSTVYDVVKEAMDVEESGTTVEDASKLIGIGRVSYVQARAIILLSMRKDLLPDEADMVKKAVEEMNEIRRTARAYRRLQPIIRKVWGESPAAPKTRRGALKRAASFSHAMTIVIDACNAAPEIHVPPLSKEEKIVAVRQIEEAMANMRKLKRKVVEGR